MPGKRLSPLPFCVPIPDDKLRSMTGSELNRYLNGALNILEKYEDAVKKARQPSVRLGYEFSTDTAKAIVKRIQDEQKRRSHEHAARADG